VTRKLMPGVAKRRMITYASTDPRVASTVKAHRDARTVYPSPNNAISAATL